VRRTGAIRISVNGSDRTEAAQPAAPSTAGMPVGGTARSGHLSTPVEPRQSVEWRSIDLQAPLRVRLDFPAADLDGGAGELLDPARRRVRALDDHRRSAAQEAVCVDVALDHVEQHEPRDPRVRRSR